MKAKAGGSSPVNLDDVDSQAANYGYTFSDVSRMPTGWWRASWVRPYEEDGFSCFSLEWIRGRQREVGVEYGYSLVPTSNSWMGIGAFSPLDRPSNISSGVYQVANKKGSSSFSQWLVPEVCGALEREVPALSVEVLASTERGRHAVSRYMAALPDDTSDLSFVYDILRAQADSVATEVIRTFPYWNVLSFGESPPENEEREILCYRIAVALFAIAESPSVRCGLFDINESVDRPGEFGICLQIIASRLHSPKMWSLK